MVEQLILGIICGVMLSLFFSFGPAFFSQLRTSIQYGFKKSYPFAFGVSAGDVLIVFLMLTVLKGVNPDHLSTILHNPWVATIGGAMLTIMGIHFFRKKITHVDESQESRIKFKSEGGEPRRRTIFMQGFVINFINPLIWIYWVSVVTLLTGELKLSMAERYIFFVGVLGTTLGLDILKSKAASLLQRVITAKVLNITNKATAVIMFAFAAYLVISMIIYQVDPQAREREQQQEPSATQMMRGLQSKKIDTSLLNLSNREQSTDSEKEPRNTLSLTPEDLSWIFSNPPTEP